MITPIFTLFFLLSKSVMWNQNVADPEFAPAKAKVAVVLSQKKSKNFRHFELCSMTVHDHCYDHNAASSCTYDLQDGSIRVTGGSSSLLLLPAISKLRPSTKVHSHSIRMVGSSLSYSAPSQTNCSRVIKQCMGG